MTARAAGAGRGPVELTPRERVALVSVAVGLTQDAAARRLGTSPRTVRRALVSAMERLGARSLAHAVAVAAMSGQLDLGAVERGELPEWPAGPTLRQIAVIVEVNRAAAEARAPHLEFRRARVAALLRQGLPVAEVAVRVGVSASTVYDDRRLLRRAGSG